MEYLAGPLTVDAFIKAVTNNKPVLVDFYATWCGPCKALATILEQLKGEYDGKATILKIDVDENPELASEYNIRSVPTLMVFKNGNILQTVKGFPGKAKVEDLLKESL